MTHSLAIRLNPANPDHHLWNNNGTWWCHYTVHPTLLTKQRIRLSLGTQNLAEALLRRDQLLSCGSWNGAGSERQTQLITSGTGALKVKDAANYLGVSPISVRRLIQRGLIKPNRALRHVLIPIGELNRFLAEGQR